MDVEDLHPLRDRVKYFHICPPLKHFKKCFKKKPNFKHALRKTILEEMNIKLPKSESQVIEDPFLILGYGLNAYFDIMTALAGMCLMITLFISPVIMNYAHNEIDGLKDDPKYMFNQFTIGNLGGSGVYCNQRRIGVGEMKLDCPNGNILVDQYTKFGIMSTEVLQKMHCTDESVFSSFNNDSSAYTNCT